MAKLYVDKSQAGSRIVWLYVIQTKPAVDVVAFDGSDLELAAINAFKTTPFLVDDDTVVWGSQAVLYYIAEKFSDFQGLGKTPEERAKIESIMGWACGPLQRTIGDTFVPALLDDHNRLPGQSHNEVVELGKYQTQQQLQTLENHYFQANRKFLVDTEAQFIDYLVFIILASLDAVHFDVKPYPKTACWLSEMKRRTSSYDVGDHSVLNGD